MKNSVLGIFVLLSVMGVTAVTGQVILPPGTQATLTANPASGGSATTNAHSSFVLDSAYDVDAKTLKAKATVASVVPTIGTGVAHSQIFYDFEVPATPGTSNNTVGAWVSYSVDWRGFQSVAAAGASNSIAEVDVVLRDVTIPQNQRFEPVHSLDLATHKIKFVTAGLTFNDDGLKVDTFSAVLRRGHSYRLTVRLTVSVGIITTVAAVGRCDYMDAIVGDPRGVQLNSLFVKVGLDEREVLRLLNEFQDHRHTYLTGRGTGHNNVEAVSSPPIEETKESGSDGSPPVEESKMSPGKTTPQVEEFTTSPTRTSPPITTIGGGSARPKT